MLVQAEGHEFAFQTAVVKAALLVRAPSKAAFKARMAGNRREGKAGVPAQKEPHIAIKRFAGLAVAQPFTVRRVTQESTAFFVKLAISHIGNLERHAAVQPCLMQMAAGEFNGLGIDISAGNALDALGFETGLGFFA